MIASVAAYEIDQRLMRRNSQAYRLSPMDSGQAPRCYLVQAG